MSQPIIGIDLGTSTSEICVFRNGVAEPIKDPATKSPIVPSLVALNRTGELVVGEDARSNIDNPGKGVREVKRKMGSGDVVLLGGKEYRPEVISGILLKKLKENAEIALGTTVRDVVLSVPANFADAARTATKNAGEHAGLNIVRLINEPTAAALAFGTRNLDHEGQVLVFDFGGGTLDITVLEMMAGVLDVKASYGDPLLGGKDFDEALVQLILGKFQAAHRTAVIGEKARNMLKGQAELVKKALSGNRSATAQLASFATAGGELVDLEVDVTRQEFERAVAPLLDRARACVAHALAAKKIRPAAIDRVLLVGGTTYVPCVQQLVAELFGKEPIRNSDVDPDLAVCMGAAVQAGLIAGAIDPAEGIIITEVSSFGLGIPIVGEVAGTQTLVYEPLIRPNTTIPYTFNKSYSLLSPDQPTVNVHLYQDHKGDARLPADAIDTGIEARIAGIPPSRTGVPHSLELAFSYNMNGLVTLEASIPATGQSMRMEYAASRQRTDREGKQEAQRDVEELWTKNPHAKRYEGILAKGKRLREAAGGAKTPQLQAAITALQQALAGDDAGRIETAGDTLADLIVDLDLELGA